MHVIEQQTLGSTVNLGVVTLVTDHSPNLVILQCATILIN
jgi:hypothetical protein